MPWSKKDDPLLSEIESGLNEVRKSAPPPPEDVLHLYLKNVYRLRRSLSDHPSEKTVAVFKKLAKRAHPRVQKNFTRVIIDLTAGKHVTSKMKGKYADALNWAFVSKVKSKDVVAFLKKKGGLNARIEEYGAFLTRQAKG